MNDSAEIASHSLAHTGSEPHLLRELYRANQALFNNLPRIAGISASRLALMRLLAIDLPKEAGIMEIARRLGINAAAATRLVREAEFEAKEIEAAIKVLSGIRNSLERTK